jgi:putative molybdopterin biosynthesis protein
MSVYIKDIPLDQAMEHIRSALKNEDLWCVLGEEELPVNETAVGRVLSKPVWAKLSSPHYHASAMDGFALLADDTKTAQPNSPLILRIGENAFYVDTGDVLPERTDSVIPIENVETLDESEHPTQPHQKVVKIRIRNSVAPWSHIRPMGEDMVATQLVLPTGVTIRPVDLGAIAACGTTTITVSRKPIVGILPTGSELMEIGKPVKAGDIIEYNSIVLASQVNQWGGDAHRSTITKDDFTELCSKVASAAEKSDLVLLNAGSSAGSEDFSAKVVESLGKLIFHGVAVRPGHPVIFGMLNVVKQGKKGWVPIIGVPGYPVSAALTGEIFIKPILDVWLGRNDQKSEEIFATLTKKITSPAGDDDFVRVVVGKVRGELKAAPLQRGAGIISSLVRADGITMIPRGIQGVESGKKIAIHLYRSIHELENTIFAIGSHDMTLDVLAQFLSMHGRRFVSSNVGSQGGLIAIERGEAHIAGTHLLDPVTGEYNLSYIKSYIKSVPVRLMTWVEREQGLIVKRDNPLEIRTLSDLVKKKVRFVNRQHGAGTRVLLDFHLQKLGIKPIEINGYENEEFTHLAVAASIASGRSDCGLGIPAAANALDLGFIPLFHERYDFVIPKDLLESSLLSPLFKIMDDPLFKKTINKMPGYDIKGMGGIIAEISG